MNEVLFVFVIVLIILLITILPFPQYWGGGGGLNSSSSNEHATGKIETRNALRSLCKYTKKPLIKTQLFGLIDRIVGIVLPKRMNQFTKKMKESGLYNDMYMLDAIKGSNLNKDQLEKNGLWDRLKDKRANRPVRMNELGCSLSHLCILQDFLDSNDNYVLIFEDDIKSATSDDMEIFESAIEDIRKLSLKFDAFYLSYSSELSEVSNFADATKLMTISNYFFHLKGVHCANAVIFSRQGAAKVLAKSLPILKPIDKVLFLSIKDGSLLAYGMIYRIFDQDRDISSEITGYGSIKTYKQYFQFENKRYNVTFDDFNQYLKDHEGTVIENFELIPKVKSKFKTMNMRKFAGIGNQLGVYCFWYLKALNDGTEFNYNENIAKINKFGLDFFDFFPQAIKHRKESPKENIPELAKLRHPFKDRQKDFPSVHDIALYQNYRSLLQTAVGISSDTIKPNNYDITIHLRFDDVLQGVTSYTVFPAKFYSEVLSTITASKEKVVIVCAKPHNEFLEVAFKKTLEAVKNSPGVKSVDVQSKTPKEDFYTLLGSNIYIMSTGTFTFFAGFLSPTVKEIHVPYFGINATDDGIPIYSADWKSTKETKIIIHRNVPSKQITKIEEL